MHDSLIVTWFRRETIKSVSVVAACFVKCFFCRFHCSCSNWGCSCRFESTHQSTGYFTDILLNCPAEYQRYVIVTYYSLQNRRYFFAFFGRAIAQSGRGAPSLVARVSRPHSLRACLPSKNAKKQRLFCRRLLLNVQISDTIALIISQELNLRTTLSLSQ